MQFIQYYDYVWYYTVSFKCDIYKIWMMSLIYQTIFKEVWVAMYYKLNNFTIEYSFKIYFIINIKICLVHQYIIIYIYIIYIFLVLLHYLYIHSKYIKLKSKTVFLLPFVWNNEMYIASVLLICIQIINYLWAHIVIYCSCILKLNILSGICIFCLQ